VNASDHAADAVGLLREQLQMSLTTIDAIDRKLALLVPVLGGIAALTAPAASGTSHPSGILIAGLLIAALAAGLSLFGLLTRPAHIGPDARKVAWRIREPYPSYHRDVAQALQASIKANGKLVDRKARSFNIAAVSATSAILLLVAAKAAEIH
jgi:hypothetical protein